MDKKVLIFGTFDGLHDGHIFFISQAKKVAENLIICVARDEIVFTIKNHYPKKSLENRMRILSEKFTKAIILAGDEALQKWSAVLEHKPEIIALGYDQMTLYQALSKDRELFPFLKDIIIIKDHRGQELHSSILNYKNIKKYENT